MNLRLLFAIFFLFAALCSNPSKNVDENQITKIVFNNYYRYMTTAAYSDTDVIDTIVTYQRLISDDTDSTGKEIITIQDSGYNTVQSKYMQDRNGIFLLESVAGNEPPLSKRQKLNMLYDFFPVVIYGLRIGADSSYSFKNNVNDSIQGSETFIGNQVVSSNGNRYTCSVIKNTTFSSELEHTIYYSNIGLIKKIELDTIDKTTLDSTSHLVSLGKVTTTYSTELLETR
jgi:hypothetical protein